MSHSEVRAREVLIRWFLVLLDRLERPWKLDQISFLDSLLQDEEGTKTLAELAVTRTRIKASGLGPHQVEGLDAFASALEAFWENPSFETYDMLRTAGRLLENRP